MTQTHLTKDITLEELACKDGTPVPHEYIKNAERVAGRGQVLRDFFDAPIDIHCGYRTAAHNAEVKGAEHSQHLTASAIDFSIRGVPPAEVRKVFEALVRIGVLPDGGLGAYDTFTHLDIRPAHARWTGPATGP